MRCMLSGVAVIVASCPECGTQYGANAFPMLDGCRYESRPGGQLEFRRCMCGAAEVCIRRPESGSSEAWEDSP